VPRRLALSVVIGLAACLALALPALAAPTFSVPAAHVAVACNSDTSCYPPVQPRSSITAVKGDQAKYCVDNYKGNSGVKIYDDSPRPRQVGSIQTNPGGHGCTQIPLDPGCHTYTAYGLDMAGDPARSSAQACGQQGNGGGSGHGKGSGGAAGGNGHGQSTNAAQVQVLGLSYQRDVGNIAGRQGGWFPFTGEDLMGAIAVAAIVTVAGLILAAVPRQRRGRRRSRWIRAVRRAGAR